MAPIWRHLASLAAAAAVATALATPPRILRRQSSNSTGLDSCPGYAATNVQTSGNTLTANLALAGTPCNAYGTDLGNLTLLVEYQTDDRLHVLIADGAQQVYQVPDFIVERPGIEGTSGNDSCELKFSYIANPFSFAVTRASNGEVLFNTTGTNIVFESQYLRLRTQLPSNPYLYGLGEDTDPWRLNTTNYIRTMWNRDNGGVPTGTNLYGDHPVYFDNRGSAGTHGVFFLNSNGMDIFINNSAETGQYLEYNTLGGVLDFYFLAGPNPIQVSQQYSEIVGKPAMMPYRGFGFHQCRYGMQDVFEVAAVVSNYSTAGIPLETMWTDIDYMNGRRIMTLDPDRFPLYMMQQLISTLHERGQFYTMMVDPAVAAYNYSAYNNGIEAGAFLKYPNGSIFEGVVWPGATVFPDWMNPATQTYWNNEFNYFFNDDNGLSIDFLWIDMNEASNFMTYPFTNPVGFANASGDPPTPPPIRYSAPYPIPGFPADFQPGVNLTIPDYTLTNKRKRSIEGRSVPEHELKEVHALGKRQSGPVTHGGLPGRDLNNPLYHIHDSGAQQWPGGNSNKTIDVAVQHNNGLYEYDVHNLFGMTMSMVSRNAMLSRRPNDRPLIITRSTFAGSGAWVGHWLGDNSATWDDYRISIGEMMDFSAMYHIPMVGADVCGYNGETTPTLCARWATLGAFSPFFRNHQSSGTLDHEFYRWNLTAEAAKTGIDARYRLLDYFYTQFYFHNQTGTPSLNPLFFLYPNDTNTFGLNLQFFFGNAILVSPVTDENSTSVDLYLPDDQFYDFWTGEPVNGTGEMITLNDVAFTTIPLHYRGGTIVPQRVASANTTTELRKQNFEIVIAPGRDGTAEGDLYLDEGNAISQPQTSMIHFTYANGMFSMNGTFDYDPGVVIQNITVLGSASGGYGGGSSNTSGISLTGPYSTRLS